MTSQLWAPWRLQYIESSGARGGCIFCDFPQQKPANDAANLLVYRGEHSYLILNRFPYANGHIMVVPYRHTDSLDAVSDAEMLDVMRLTRLAVRVLRAAFDPDGFNAGLNLGRVAGAGIADHLHWHVVPRWNGDSNFMPVIADVRVIPESLEVAYRRLTAVVLQTTAAPESTEASGEPK